MSACGVSPEQIFRYEYSEPFFEAANRVAYHAVQLHGGYGYMREFPVEGFFRDVRLWTIASGTSEVMREIIAKRLL